MGFFQKLFGKNDVPQSTPAKPDNTRLINLILTYNNTNEASDYKKVIDELMTGNSFLILPSVNEDNINSEEWDTAKAGSELNLTSVFNVEGLTVLGVFTSESKLQNWAKQGSQYTAMHAKDVIAFCEENQIDRVVIDTDSDTFFVLERSRDNIKTVTVEKETRVQVGSPAKPFDSRIIGKLNEQFKRVSTVEEVYQYAQIMESGFSLMLGFKLSVVSENSKAAAFNALQSALENEDIDQPLSLFIINDEGWYTTIKGIENSLVYKKE